MDEVAGELGMSKKTLYQYFSDKNELVAEATKAHLSREESELKDVFRRSENAIEELFLVSKCMRSSLDELNPGVLYDLKRYYPDSWKQWIAFKDKFIFKSIVENIKKGMADGHFRRDINPEVLASLRVWEIQSLFDADAFPIEKYDFKSVQLQLFTHFIYGIATQKGLELYEKYIEKESEKDETYV